MRVCQFRHFGTGHETGQFGMSGSNSESRKCGPLCQMHMVCDGFGRGGVSSLLSHPSLREGRGTHGRGGGRCWKGNCGSFDFSPHERGSARGDPGPGAPISLLMQAVDFFVAERGAWFPAHSAKDAEWTGHGSSCWACGARGWQVCANRGAGWTVG